jgi:hypothetical protein
MILSKSMRTALAATLARASSLVLRDFWSQVTRSFGGLHKRPTAPRKWGGMRLRAVYFVAYQWLA